MAFSGWPAEALEFYEGLEADNTKKYWHAHKADYETLVCGPMQDGTKNVGRSSSYE